MTRYIKGIRQALLFPLLVAVSSVLFLYWKAANDFAPAQALRTLLAFAGVVAVLAPILQSLLRDENLTGAVLGWLSAALLYSDEAMKLVGGCLLAVFLVWCVYSLLKREVRVALLVSMFLVGMAVVITAELALLGTAFRGLRLADYAPRVPPQPSIVLSEPGTRPDIYYIVLDSYARADVLQDDFSFDNTPFIEYLESRGFAVPERVCTNYPKTALSVASTLNLQYVDEFAPELADSQLWWTLSPYIAQNRLRGALEPLGYRTFAVASDFPITDVGSVAYYARPYPANLNGFEGYALNATLLGRMIGPILPIPVNGSCESHRGFLENAFVSLPAISKIAGPKLVLAHIVAPHPPFVYDADGRDLTPSYPCGFNDEESYPGSTDEYRRLYVGQLRYLNARLQQAIDGIIANSSGPAVIVLQGDHGPRPPLGPGESREGNLRQRFAVLAAYRMPGKAADTLPSDMSSVNGFRVILREYFGADLPMLEHKAYYAEPMYIRHLPEATNQLLDDCSVLPRTGTLGGR